MCISVITFIVPFLTSLHINQHYVDKKTIHGPRVKSRILVQFYRFTYLKKYGNCHRFIFNGCSAFCERLSPAIPWFMTFLMGKNDKLILLYETTKGFPY